MKASTGKILNTAAAVKKKTGKDMKKKLIKALTKIGGDSTIRNGLSDLKKLKYITVTADTLVVTDLGMKNADLSDVDLDNSATTNEEYQATALEPLKLTNMAKEIFDAIKDGRVYNKADVISQLNKSNNSTMRNAFAELKNKGVIEDKGGRNIQVAADYFPFEPRPE